MEIIFYVRNTINKFNTAFTSHILNINNVIILAGFFSWVVWNSFRIRYPTNKA